ncbi:MAG: hypothetical protein R3E31_20395 [Chloroflexota bacterium]
MKTKSLTMFMAALLAFTLLTGVLALASNNTIYSVYALQPISAQITHLRLPAHNLFVRQQPYLWKNYLMAQVELVPSANYQIFQQSIYSWSQNETG